MISREIKRHGGAKQYRAAIADTAAWESALRPKPCKLIVRRLLINPVPALQELRGDETITLLDESQELPVWGVVAYALTDVAGLGFNHPPDE